MGDTRELSIDELAEALRNLSGMDLERLWDRFTSSEIGKLIDPIDLSDYYWRPY